tara:strand:- start:382 stop:822 length:441 start_codon:yes stop_codon:yes gene_type:complete
MTETMTDLMNHFNSAMENHAHELCADLIRKLAEEHGFSAEEACAKYLPTQEPKPVKMSKKDKKPKKDPNKPKRGKNPFMLYSSAKRAEMKAANPDSKPTEIAKMLGATWADLDDEDKKEYVEAAAKDKERYEKEMAVWKDNQSDSD